MSRLWCVAVRIGPRIRQRFGLGIGLCLALRLFLGREASCRGLSVFEGHDGQCAAVQTGQAHLLAIGRRRGARAVDLIGKAVHTFERGLCRLAVGNDGKIAVLVHQRCRIPRGDGTGGIVLRADAGAPVREAHVRINGQDMDVRLLRLGEGIVQGIGIECRQDDRLGTRIDGILDHFDLHIELRLGLRGFKGDVQVHFLARIECARLGGIPVGVSALDDDINACPGVLRLLDAAGHSQHRQRQCAGKHTVPV